ncbi:hypothetical protein SEEV1955_08652 [Salmonella enterica subsp. enterica serovar Virchow str. ATCC 51955]|nr:hypothetical protein SEEV1955_08652 [Salmonella enterica subsp. enterica serovar Virchow str. ATCC 51955]
MRNQRFQRLGGKGDVELPTKIQNCLGANVAIKGGGGCQSKEA